MRTCAGVDISGNLRAAQIAGGLFTGLPLMKILVRIISAETNKHNCGPRKGESEKFSGPFFSAGVEGWERVYSSYGKCTVRDAQCSAQQSILVHEKSAPAGGGGAAHDHQLDSFMVFVLYAGIVSCLIHNISSQMYCFDLEQVV